MRLRESQIHPPGKESSRIGPRTNFLPIERRISQAVRSRVYRDEVPAKVEIPLECRLTTFIQDCSNQVRVNLPALGAITARQRGSTAPSPVFMRKASRSYDARPASVKRVGSSVASNCRLMDCPRAMSASRAVGIESCLKSAVAE